MGEIVNLRRVRKRKEREREDAAADQNRLTFGRAKAERKLAEREHEKAVSALDGHRLTPPDGR
jgi:hypothetical protein